MKFKNIIFKVVIFCVVISLFSGCSVNRECFEVPKENTDITVEYGEEETEHYTEIVETEPIEAETEPEIIEKVEEAEEVTESVTEEPTEEVVEEVAEPATEPVEKPTEPKKEEPKPKYVSLGEFKLTAYCDCYRCCNKTDGITASGTKATQGRTIAVDPKKIPYGTKVVINGNTYVAEDCGGSIKGNRIDIFFFDHQDAWDFGIQYAEVFVLSN